MAYTVVGGDTLNKIAAANGLSLSQLIALNPNPPWTDPNLINPGMQVNVTAADTGISDETGATGTSNAPEAIPKNAKLVKIGITFRVIWDLGGGLGWAWYDISRDQRIELYGGPNPVVDFTFSNVSQFEGQFGNNYWGNLAEVNLKAETPWQDLKERIFAQFGYVPGFDDPEIKRLLIQGYFEGWSQSQWLVEYRNTGYFQNTTDAQRRWVALSEAEKQQDLDETAVR